MYSAFDGVRMDFLRRAVLFGFALALLWSGSSVALAQEASRDKSPAVLPTDSVMHDLCAKEVVFLGEPPVHGFGKVLDFKVELTRRLITECHFNGFFIESGIYDFLNIERARKAGKKIGRAHV